MSVFGNVFGNQPMIIRQRASQYNIMDEVAIVSDTLNFGYPVGQKGYITHINPDAMNAYAYVVRVPSTKEAWLMPECDLMPWTMYLSKSVNNAVHTYYTNQALDNGNEDLFNHHAKEIDE